MNGGVTLLEVRQLGIWGLSYTRQSGNNNGFVDWQVSMFTELQAVGTNDMVHTYGNSDQIVTPYTSWKEPQLSIRPSRFCRR
jgi:hypothetical protein